MYKRRNFLIPVVLAVFAVCLVSGCGTMAIKIDKDKLAKVKKIAVINLTVPDVIEYREDPKEPKAPSSLLDVAVKVAQEASKGDGVKAATISLKTFCSELNKQGLSFKAMSLSQVLKNKKFKALYVPPEKKEGGGMMGTALGFFGGGGPKGVSPDGIMNYGIVSNAWDVDTALTGAEGEKEYIEAAIKALNVDAVLLIQDTGYCFSCNACVGAGGIMSGDASTGSTFIATLLDKNLEPMLSLKEYFLTTSGHAAMVSNIIVPPLHENLFVEHGKKMAVVFAEFLKKELAKKEE